MLRIKVFDVDDNLFFLLIFFCLNNISSKIDFATNLSNLMKAASPDEKNMLLRRLLTNCILDGEVLKYEIKSPFDKLLACSNYKKWKDIAINNLEDFESLN